MSPDTSKLRQYDRGRDLEWDERKVAVAIVRATESALTDAIVCRPKCR
jgi:hypothetical protein